MYSLICESLPTVSESGMPECLEGWTTQVAVVAFDISQISPEVATVMFGAGFGLCIAPWAAAYGVKYLLRLIQY